MAKSPLLHAAERCDLIDLQYGLSGFSRSLQSKLLRSVYGSGVLDGFRIRVPDQLGSEKGHIVIYNGEAPDWGGNLINSETGTNSERIVLSAANMEYWIELELDYADADPDSRAFWDPLVDNPDPIPDGQEIQIPRTMTRQVPYWRVRRPIRSNPVGLRSSSGYVPAHFSPSSENVIPIAVIRTNNQRQVEIGDASTTSYGNDIVPVLTQEDAVNPRNFLKVPGYGESHGTANGPYGRKFSDQRPRMFNPLLPSFQYGDTNEVLGDSLHDGWARDLASVFDHLASQIKQIKTGAGAFDHGETSTCTYEGFATDFSYVDVSVISQNVPGPPLTADPDRFIGCTFQIVSGHWGGFYAEILGNDRTGLHAIGNTRLLLGRKSPIPEWKELPRGTVSCQIVQQREVNWLTKPCPSTDFRGLNALDTEVYSSRTDWHSGVEFDNLRARLNAGKLPTLTVSPVATEDPDTGEPSSITHPRADVFQSLTEIQTRVGNAFSTRGGLIHFRRGTYDFSTITSGTAFSVANAEGFVVEGEGSETTVLEYVVTGLVRKLFSLSGCKNILFKDLTLRSSGTPIQLSGCENIHFENCVIDGEFIDLSTPSLSLDSFTLSSFTNTSFYLTGTGIVANSVNNSVFRDCRFLQTTESPTNAFSLLRLGTVDRSRFVGCLVRGFVSTVALECSSFTNSYLSDSEIAVTQSGTSSNGIFTVTGTAYNSRFHHLTISNNSNVIGTGTFTGMKFNYLSTCFLDNIYFGGIGGGVYVVNDMTRSSVSHVRSFFNDNAFGVTVDGLFTNSVIDNCSFVTGGSSGVGIKIQGVILHSFILNNDVNSQTQISKCIEINSTSIQSLIVQGNTLSRSQYGIYFNNIAGGRRIFVKDNIAQEIGVDAYSFKLSTDLQYFVFSGNSCSSTPGTGLTIDASGVPIRNSLFSGNVLDCGVRAFEIWSTSGGSLYGSIVSGNSCTSTSRSAFAVGNSVKGATPSAGVSPFVVSDSLIKQNIIKTSEATATTYYSLYVSSLWTSFVENNIVVGGNNTSTLYVEKGVLGSYVSSNQIYASIGSGSHGIRLDGDTLEDSLVNNNLIYTAGVGHEGIFMVPGATNEVTRFNFQGNLIRTASAVAANGIYLNKGRHCNISSNTTYNFDTGILITQSNYCMASSNLLVNCATNFMDLSLSSYIKGAATAVAVVADPAGWLHDGDLYNNNVSAFNVGF